MSFTDIALKNLRRKFGSYLIYFFSTAFSVLIFSLFCSMYYNPSFEQYRFGTGKMTTLFRASAIAVLLFAAVFVLYSGSYFIKTQKQQIAIYSLLGMRKGRIALLMFLETFIVGMLAVAAGTLLGSLSAGYFMALLMRFMAVGTSVSFSVEPRAILATAAAFTALFIVSGIRAYMTIYRYTLIQLLSASRQSEGLPEYSVPGALLSLALLAAGYTVSGTISMYDGGLSLLLPAFAAVALVVAGTYLLFRNLAPMAVAAVKRSRRLYYRTADIIAVSQLAFRLKANSRLLSAAAVLCAVTVTMISASYSLYSGLEDGTRYYAPFSYLVKNITPAQREEIAGTVARIGEVRITAEDRIELVGILIQNDAYAVQDGQGDAVAPGEQVPAYLMAESAYLKLIDDTGARSAEDTNLGSGFSGGLGRDECFFLDGNVTLKYGSALAGELLNVSCGDASLALTVAGVSLHKYIGLLDLYQRPTAVVEDSVFEAARAQAPEAATEVFDGYVFDDDMASGPTVDALNRIVPPRFEGGLPDNLSYIGMYKANFSLYGSYVFIGLFIGLLFLLATGSVLYYKLIMEAQEEAPRYDILRKTGLTAREALGSVVRQLGLVFGLPLAVGLVHTVFALRTYNRMLDLMGQETPTLQNAAMVALLFVLVYGAFYALSVKSCYSIVWSRPDRV